MQDENAGHPNTDGAAEEQQEERQEDEGPAAMEDQQVAPSTSARGRRRSSSEAAAHQQTPAEEGSAPGSRITRRQTRLTALRQHQGAASQPASQAPDSGSDDEMEWADASEELGASPGGGAAGAQAGTGAGAGEDQPMEGPGGDEGEEQGRRRRQSARATQAAATAHPARGQPDASDDDEEEEEEEEEERQQENPYHGAELSWEANAQRELEMIFTHKSVDEVGADGSGCSSLWWASPWGSSLQCSAEARQPGCSNRWGAA